MLAPVTVTGVRLGLDPAGALVWPERRLLVVADLHLEKGAAFAGRGQLLPPYDTAETLERLEALVRRHRPERVVALGDSFHDVRSAERLAPREAARIRRLTGALEWIWVAGNHDPEMPGDLGGRAAPELVEGPLRLRHEPQPRGAPGEVAGHLHPRAAVTIRYRTIRAGCFVTDGRRLLLPAFGAYTGGLDVHAPAIRGLFRPAFRVFLEGRERLHELPAARLDRGRT